MFIHLSKMFRKLFRDKVSVAQVGNSSYISISRVTGASINTVSKLLVDAGNACAKYHDETVRDVKAERVQCDEIWSFVAAKQKNVADMKEPVDGAGDVWTWTALDAR